MYWKEKPLNRRSFSPSITQVSVDVKKLLQTAFGKQTLLWIMLKRQLVKYLIKLTIHIVFKTKVFLLKNRVVVSHIFVQLHTWLIIIGQSFVIITYWSINNWLRHYRWHNDLTWFINMEQQWPLIVSRQYGDWSFVLYMQVIVLIGP